MAHAVIRASSQTLLNVILALKNTVLTSNRRQEIVNKRNDCILISRVAFFFSFFFFFFFSNPSLFYKNGSKHQEYRLTGYETYGFIQISKFV